ncbi:metal ABC transporter substrate-binding protein [Oerskovia sp. M15]
MPLHSRPIRAALVSSVALATTLTLAACGSGGASGGGSGGDASSTVDVLASFYPLQFVAERVGGDRVEVSNLTPPAAEPHDLELSPHRRARSAPRTSSSTSPASKRRSTRPSTPSTGPRRRRDRGCGPRGAPGRDRRRREREHGGRRGRARRRARPLVRGRARPHFWLDPTRLIPVAEEVAAELSAVDPDGADEYAANLADLTADLTALDTELSEGLANCASPYLVTSHEAFGYLAERYGLEQVGITGIDPEAEPSPARLREVADIIRDHGVTTIFFETLTSPKVTQTLAQDVGVTAAVLDPLEGLSDTDKDYLDVMRTNLEALRTGLTCA